MKTLYILEMFHKRYKARIVKVTATSSVEAADKARTLCGEGWFYGAVTPLTFTADDVAEVYTIVRTV